MSYPPPAYGYPAYSPPPDHPQATIVLILGIVGMMFSPSCAPFAWVLGRRALNEIDASGGAVGGRDVDGDAPADGHGERVSIRCRSARLLAKLLER